MLISTVSPCLVTYSVEAFDTTIVKLLQDCDVTINMVTNHRGFVITDNFENFINLNIFVSTI